MTLAAAARKKAQVGLQLETRLLASGPIAGGALEGDLVVVGSGDPSLMNASAGGPPPFDAWIAALKQRGIQRVTGRIVGDDSAFEQHNPGFGWSWDDLVEDYSAPAGALQFNEGAVRVIVTPAAVAHQRPSILVEPATSDLDVRSIVTTGAADSTPRVAPHRTPAAGC